jgi:metal transporter CNNM
MTPAPKSRVPKGRIVEDPTKGSAALEVDQANNADVDSKSPKPSENERRQSSVEAPPPRFQLRKQYSDPNALSTDGWVTHRGATDEIREHLKHLGPSNLASRPRQTRYQNVKIKRGSTSPTRSGQTDVESGRSMSDTPRYVPPIGHQGGIGAGVLQSAGQDAKDGVYALKHGYGTMAPPTATNTNTAANPQPANDFSQLSIPEMVTEEQDDGSRQGDQTRHGSAQESATVSVRSSDSQNGGDRPKPGGTFHHRGPARSGSITEQVVDVNGVRKVVLHTTSSPSSPESESRTLSHRSEHRNGQPSDSSDDDAQSGKRSTKTNGTKKKRRRKRRGNSSKKSDRHPNDEQRPLLAQ